MTDLSSLNAPINAESLIKEALTARKQWAADQAATHIRAVLSRLNSHVNPSPNRNVKQLLTGFFDDCAGPIRGLRLPRNVWVVLKRENITTRTQLSAVADQIDEFAGIGAETALAIRVELGRITLLETLSPDPH